MDTNNKTNDRKRDERPLAVIKLRNALIMSGLMISDIVLLFIVAQHDLKKFQGILLFQVLVVIVSLIVAYIVGITQEYTKKMDERIIYYLIIALMGFAIIFSLIQSFNSGDYLFYIIQLIFVVCLGCAGVLYIFRAAKVRRNEKDQDWAMITKKKEET